MKTLFGLLLVCSSLLCTGVTSCTQAESHNDSTALVNTDLQFVQPVTFQVTETGQAIAFEVASVSDSPIRNQEKSFACNPAPHTRKTPTCQPAVNSQPTTNTSRPAL